MTKRKINISDYADTIIKALPKGILLTTQAEKVNTMVITLECRVMYVQKQDLSALSEEINRSMYPRDVDSTATGANKDPHVTFFGEIVDAYIIED